MERGGGMQKKIDTILRVCFLAVIVLLCYLVVLSVRNIVNMLMFEDMVVKAVPIDADISFLAGQLEGHGRVVELDYEMADGENFKDVIYGIFDMAGNYSDEAAKASMHMESIRYNKQEQTIGAIQVNYEESETGWDSLEREYDRMYEEICGNVINIEKASDRRKLNAILAYMAKEFSYDQDYGKKQLLLYKRITETKKIVCAGYAEIIDELCERMDIDCRIMLNKKHAWNYVRLDGADAYIQIDGTNKYMPYLISITEFSHQPMDEVKLASVADNCIFWLHSCPLAAFLIMAILVYNVIVEIQQRMYLKKHLKKT